MSYFINMQTLEAIHQAVGVPITNNRVTNGNHGTNDVGSDDDEVTEELFESETSLSSFGFR